MARLIYSAIMSLDGYTADADGRFEWAAPDEEVFAFVNELERPPVARLARLRADLAGRRQDRLLHYAPGTGHRQDPRRAGLRPGPGPEAKGNGQP